ncbi:hypothetical protein HCN44_008577 [Aphidius gifuensis]|uniref:Odorant-binding protein n=1 Tax=Aphidius gifuensis TaxID=684658 RepID=A0A834XNY5_APHGI|nr:uncharacterized protein LOC122856547 [Aphidius gifuensis]KAF7989903.1 hypothetical protein HCN44_008577 [Aphidius gifuensis]
MIKLNIIIFLTLVIFYIKVLGYENTEEISTEEKQDFAGEWLIENTKRLDESHKKEVDIFVKKLKSIINGKTRKNAKEKNACDALLKKIDTSVDQVVNEANEIHLKQVIILENFKDNAIRTCQSINDSGAYKNCFTQVTEKRFEKFFKNKKLTNSEDDNIDVFQEYMKYLINEKFKSIYDVVSDHEVKLKCT